MSAGDTQYAPATVRDQFLNALEGDDRQLSWRLALGLTGCGNPLPGITCQQLKLPPGSTYGSAARWVLGQTPGVQKLPLGQAL